jgi:putative pyruvate formate lyase activating enzyme
VEQNRAAIREMFRQVGPLSCDENRIARRGLCIRHLVLPAGQTSSAKVLEYLLSSFDPADIYVSLMAQYRPLHRARQFPEISRMVTAEEYEAVRNSFINAGIREVVYEQEYSFSAQTRQLLAQANVLCRQFHRG